MNFRGLLFMLLCFQASAQEPETDVFAEVAKLAKSDATTAVEMLRTSENLDPEGIYEAFSDLEAPAHFRLLNEIRKDEALANRFVFGWLSLSPTVDYESLELPSPDLEAKDIFPLVNEVQITLLLLAAPEDMPPVLTIPALGTVLKFNQLIFGLAMYADSESVLSKDEILDLLLKDVRTEKYHEVLKLVTAVSQVDLPEANDRKKSQEAISSITVPDSNWSHSMKN